MVGELSGTVTGYKYNAQEGRLTSIQTVSTVPDDFEGAARSADIHVHPSGDYVYVSNRGDANDIVRYSIEGASGRLRLEGRTGTSIEWPRNFAISPSGDYLLVANRRSDSIGVFEIDPDTGALSHTGESAAVPAPTKIEFSASQATSANEGE
jgi:6-phosphogluconolactonase